jgi:hypothetical protein
MQKLLLKLEALGVQSLVTTPAVDARRGSVIAMQEGESPESDTCQTVVYTCAGCETNDGACGDGDADFGRRIIVYQTPS